MLSKVGKPKYLVSFQLPFQTSDKMINDKIPKLVGILRTPGQGADASPYINEQQGSGPEKVLYLWSHHHRSPLSRPVGASEALSEICRASRVPTRLIHCPPRQKKRSFVACPLVHACPGAYHMTCLLINRGKGFATGSCKLKCRS